MAEINLIKEETINVDLSPESSLNAQVTDINYIPAYKQAEEERRRNELERISNENEREAYYEEIQDKVNSGEMDGKNTVFVGETEPTDDFYNVWINPTGTPEVSAENLVFTDGETLQDKYVNGELKGDKGDTGTNDYNDLENKPTIPTSTSQLTNDSGFINGYTESDPTVPSYVKEITQENITSWNNKVKTEDLESYKEETNLFLVPIGGVVEYAGATAPNGWLMCDGSAVSRTEYANLFNVIGTTFGSGDGSSTFNLPDRRGRFGIGAGQGTPDVNGDARLLNLGQQGGEYAHTLTEYEIPSHYHIVEGWLTNDATGGVDKPLIYGMGTDGTTFLAATNPIGGDGAHNNIPPYLGMNYIIKF